MTAKPKNKNKYILFIDETGVSDIDSEDNFSLLGVICEYKYSVDINEECELKRKIDKYKKDIFGRSDLVIHLLDIERGTKAYSRIDKNARKKFMNKLYNLLKDINCTIISITIDKKMLKKYYSPTKDPYVIAFSHLLQCFYSFITKNPTESARIVIEARDDKANLSVQKAFFDVFNNGGAYLKVDETIRNKISGFIMAEKGDNIYKYGLELADMLCNPLWRVKNGKFEVSERFISKREYGNKNKIFDSVVNKIYCDVSKDDISNWGFVKIPILEKTDLIKENKLLREQLKIKEIEIARKEKENRKLLKRIEDLEESIEFEAAADTYETKSIDENLEHIK